MQDHVGVEVVGGTGAALAVRDNTVPLIKKEDMWTPEDFLESTLHVHEDKRFLEDFSLRAPKNQVVTSSIPTPKVTKPRSRRKNQWKLKFHHQALPPEYLDHYEASLNKTRPMADKTHDKITKNLTGNVIYPDMKTLSSLGISNLPNESIQNWLQRITSIQNEIHRNNVTVANFPNIAPAIPPQTRNVDVEKRKKNHSNIQTHTTKVVNYQDLPYMGEMTLNNSKPRRGRKPKKADICHLIYKNYGTIFPGTPTHLVEDRLSQPGGSGLDKTYQMKVEKTDPHDVLSNVNRSKTDLQNKIIYSLLEKRLSQENKKTKDVRVKKCKASNDDTDQAVADSSIVKSEAEVEEPLNLCVRDLNNLKIRVHRKYGNVYETSSISSITPEKSDAGTLSPCSESISSSSPLICKTESVSPTPTMSIPDFKKAVQDASSPDTILGKIDTPSLPGYVYWPNAGVFVHPVALQSQLMYYQKAAANSNYTLPLPEDSSESTMPSTPSSIDSDAQVPLFHKPAIRDSKRSIIPKQISELLDPSILSKQIVSPNEIRESPNIENMSSENHKLKRLASQTALGIGHGKRKRSAIFIPPLPTENNTNPTTEVSICKFKFTGGAKPSLQEKKMLSVDSGGNFRYYSGTGDKANRGYEFFPRETLQQPAGSEQASSSGVFLNASGEKMPVAPSNVCTQDESINPKGQSNPSTSTPKAISPNENDLSRRKRKSRKSMQREKLEQTFKEKGFLIQTQQLESAEGATYCKFRQLRKFTRYLFRSWKDYLPENLQNEEVNPHEVPIPMQAESSSEGPWS